MKPSSRVLLLSLLGAAYAPADVIKGPYLVDMTPDSARVRLEADSPGHTEVVVWPEARRGLRTAVRAKESSYEVINSVLSSQSSQRSLEQKEERFLYDALLTGLAPATTYGYEVRHDGAPSGGGTFRTFPRDPERVTFLAIGDVRTGHHFHRALAMRMAKERAAFLTIAGDLVVDGKIYANWQYYFDIQGPLLRDVPVFPAWGNHEGRDGFFEKYFPFPDNNRDRSFFFWRRLYNRSFDCGPVHVLLLDSGVSLDSGDLKWIDDDLEAARDRPWKIAVYHHPSFNEGGHGSAYGLSKLVPLFKKHRLDLTITGHSHLYERTFPLKSASKDEQPIVHVVCGGGGAPLVQNQDAFYLAQNRKAHHYLRFEADAEQLIGTAIDIDGVVFDRFVLEKPKKPSLARGNGSVPPAEPEAREGAPPEAAGSDSAALSAERRTLPEENVMLWRTLKGLLNTSGKLLVPPKDSPPKRFSRLPWVLRVPACPVPVKLEVELRLDPVDAAFWKLTPDVDRFEWNAVKLDRLFWLEPRNAEALQRESTPRVIVRMDSPFGPFVQGGRLGVTFVRDGKATRRDRI